VRSALSAPWGAADAIQTLWQQRSSTSNQGVLASSSPTASGQGCGIPSTNRNRVFCAAISPRWMRIGSLPYRLRWAGVLWPSATSRLSPLTIYDSGTWAGRLGDNYAGGTSISRSRCVRSRASWRSLGLHPWFPISIAASRPRDEHLLALSRGHGALAPFRREPVATGA
jgi:hypothetical protein